MGAVLQYGLYLAVLVLLGIPLGAYIKKVMDGEKTFLSRVLTPCENLVYKAMRVKKDEQMNWKKYLLSVLLFNGIGLVFLFLLQLLQGVLPGNPQGLPGVKWDLSFKLSVTPGQTTASPLPTRMAIGVARQTSTAHFIS